MTTSSGKIPVTAALLGACAQRTAKAFLIVTDLGLLAYWTLTAVGVISVGTGDVLLAWNWSFLPLDSLAAALGCWGVHLVGRGRPFGREILIVGLTLTFCAGLMVVSFWALYGDVNLGWWAPNIVLMIVPCVLYGKLLREDPQR